MDNSTKSHGAFLDDGSGGSFSRVRNENHTRPEQAVLRISQTDHTRSILDRFNMKDCNPASTLSTGAELSLDQPTDTLAR